MRKIFFALTILCLALTATSQEAGFRTTDVGGAYQYTPDYNAFSLHLGFNAEEFHSFIVRASYLKAGNQKTSLHNNESGSGWGAYFGYRYHFSVIPKRFFLGIGVGTQFMNVDWVTAVAPNIGAGTTKLVILQPTIEAGYTLVINDYMYITPSVSGVLQSKLNSKGADVNYGSGFLPAAGISIGWRF